MDALEVFIAFMTIVVIYLTWRVLAACRRLPVGTGCCLQERWKGGRVRRKPQIHTDRKKNEISGQRKGAAEFRGTL